MSITDTLSLGIVDIGPAAVEACRDSTIGCNSHGWCVQGVCACVDYWTGATCTETFHDVLGHGWSSYIIVFIALFTLVAATALLQLIRSALLGGAAVFNYWRLLHVLVLLEGVFQMLDLGLAPGTSASAAPAWARRVLQGIAVYLIMAIICVILLFWCETYCRTFSTEAHPQIRRVARGYKVLLVVFFVVELTCRLMYDEVESPAVIFIVHSLFVAACCAVTAGGFLVFGRRAYSRMMKTSAAIFKNRFEQIQFLTVTASVLLILTVCTLIVFGIVAFANASLLQEPQFYLLQQIVYRMLQATYCTFILWALRVPPEIESRAVYVPIR